MQVSLEFKEFWIPKQGLQDPVLQYLLSMILKEGCPDDSCEDGQRLLELSRELNVQPIVYEVLKTEATAEQSEQTWFQQLRIDSLKIAGACSLRQKTIQKLTQVLHQAGIKPILLKGPALAWTVYPQTHWRTSYDVDFLIHPSDWDAASDLMVEMGYQSHPCLNWGYLSYEKSFFPSDDYPEAPLIELHLRLNNRPDLCVFSYDELLKSADRISIHGEEILIPDKVEHFIYLCIHRIGHYPNDRRFAWVMDLALLSRQFTEDEWKKLIELSIQKRVSRIVKVCLDDVILVLQITIPDFVMHGISGEGSVNREPSSKYLHQRYSKIHDLFNRWLEIPTARRKLAYLLRWIFPPRSYMNKFYQSRYILLQHFERLYKGVRKYFGPT